MGNGSLPRVLLWPVALYLVFGLHASGGDQSSLDYAALGAGVGLIIHLVSYFVIGFPLYVWFWRTSPDLWTWKIGLPTGAVFGAFALSAIYLMGAGVRDSPTGLMGAWLLGGAYGLATAAITSRRKITNEC